MSNVQCDRKNCCKLHQQRTARQRVTSDALQHSWWMDLRPQVFSRLRENYIKSYRLIISSEFVDTAVTDNDWVCELQTRATDLFTLGCVGLILGTAVFSWLADAKGRRLAFFLSTFAMIFFQMIQIWVSHNYGAFLAMKILAFACMLPLFQSPMSITTEISSIKGRAFVIGLSCVTWSLGNCALPAIGYLVPRWKWLVAICTLPMAFIFCTYKIIPESPRWLVTVGKMEEAKKVLVRDLKYDFSIDLKGSLLFF